LVREKKNRRNPTDRKGIPKRGRAERNYGRNINGKGSAKKKKMVYCMTTSRGGVGQREMIMT